MVVIIYPKVLIMFSHLINSFSKHRITTLLISASGKQYPGWNFETLSFNNAIHAEISALHRFLTSGDTEERIIELWVAHEGSTHLVPCGACLQTLSEMLGPSLVVHSVVLESEMVQTHILKDLLPLAYKSRRYKCD